VAQPIYPTNKGVLVHSLSGNNDMAVKSFTQADGSIVIVGDSSGQITLTRYTSTGALDTDFGSNGLLKTDFITNDQEYAADAVMQADGKILVTGGSYGSSAILARYNANGTLDTTFGDQGKVINTLGVGGFKTTIQDDGRILVAVRGADGTSLLVARYNSDGSLDTDFGNSGISDAGDIDIVGNIAIAADGGILIGGQDNSRFTLTKLDANGALDSGFGSGGQIATPNFPGQPSQTTQSGQDVLIQADGKILFVGYGVANSFTYCDIARYNSDGTLDTTYGTGGLVAQVSGTPRCAVLQPDGKLLVAMRLDNGNVAVARYDENGVLDASFGTNGMVQHALQNPVPADYCEVSATYVTDIRIDDEGQIIITGSAWNTIEDYEFMLMRLRTDGALDPTLQSNLKINAAPGIYSDTSENAVVPVSGPMVTLSPTLEIYDAELSSTNYGGATVTIQRAGGANREDIFWRDDWSFTPLTAGTSLLNYGNAVIGTVTSSSPGAVTIKFNTKATASSINDVMQSIAYSNKGKAAGSIDFDITFSDGNTGSQGLGGAKSVTHTIEVNLQPDVSDAPLFTNTDEWGDFYDITPEYVMNSTAIKLSSAVRVIDYDRAAIGHYNGSSLTLQRTYGANAQDSFHASGGLAPLVQGSSLVLNGTVIGTVLTNSGGKLKLMFNGSTSQTVLDEALRSIAYAKAGISENGTIIPLSWSFNSGGVTTTANMHVEVIAPERNGGSALTLTKGSMDMNNGFFLSVTKQGQKVSGSFGWDEIQISLKNGTATYHGEFEYYNNALVASSTFSAYSYKTSTLGFDLDLYGNMNATTYFKLAANATAFRDYVLRGNDKVAAATGNDILLGLAGNDWLSGGGGNDKLDGGVGNDTMLGGSGNDTYIVGQTGDIITELPGQGTDLVHSSITFSLMDTDKAGVNGGNLENLTLTGSASINGTGNDRANSLTGNVGNNSLNGAKGNDVLTGGLGQDKLTGGPGMDTFVFKVSGDSGLTASTRDIILDFVSGQDKINLAAIDANTGKAGNDAFNKLIAASAAFTAAGQLKFAAGILYGNTDVDAAAEFSIQLTGVSKLTLGDIVL
jgi:uncharacterized delta-60 repeat protein